MNDQLDAPGSAGTDPHSLQDDLTTHTYCETPEFAWQTAENHNSSKQTQIMEEGVDEALEYGAELARELGSSWMTRRRS